MKNVLLVFFGMLALTQFAQTDLKGQLPFDPDVVKGKLPNGLVYYIRHNEKPDNRVELRLAVKTGSTMEDDDQRGLAHLIEHMAFNGTTNFKKNELINYLEKIGTKFGPHLNAYTSFDETVYMLQVPTDSADFVLKGIQILEDWAHNISFEGEEIDKERGVVIEEWRTRLGANERMRNVYWPVLYKDSRYEHRLPIGEPEVIRKAPYERLTTSYKDWYRPDNMAVIVVGDIDVKAMEAQIIQHFSALRNPDKMREVKEWPVPDHRDLRIVHASDKEATRTNLQVYYKHPVVAIETEMDYRQQLIISLYNGMMYDRLNELQLQSDPPFTSSSTYYGNLVRTKSCYRSNATVPKGGLLRGLESIATENERVRRHGFTETELERAKVAVMRSYESYAAEKDKMESANFVYEYLNHFLQNLACPGIEKEFEICRKYLDGIALEEVNALASQWITSNGENCTVVMTAPLADEDLVPTDEQVQDVFRKISTKDVKPYVDQFLDKPLMSTLPQPGKVVSESYDKEFDFYTWVLSNGAKVLCKKTDFKDDQFLFRSESFGGTSLYQDEDYLSANYAASIVQSSGTGEFNKIQLEKSLSGKIVNVFSFVGETTETIYGIASPKDIESLFQLLYLNFQKPRKDEDAYESFKVKRRNETMNRSADPGATFQDTINLTMNKNHFRRRPITLEGIDRINHNSALDIYADRFDDAGDFVFVFVGNFEIDELKKLAEQYIGSLPSGKKESWKDVGVRKERESIKKVVKRGTEPKSSVTMVFGNEAKFSQTANMDLQCLIKLVQIKLRESLREDNSGTYGVSCNGNLSRIPREEFQITISFSCSPENVSKLKEAAIEVLLKIQREGCSEEDLQKVKEGFKREHEVAIKENQYWQNKLVNYALHGDAIMSEAEFEKYFAEISSDDIIDFARRYFNTSRFAEFVLMPENQ